MNEEIFEGNDLNGLLDNQEGPRESIRLSDRKTLKSLMPSNID